MRLVALLLITATGVFAQTASTQILGLVTDSTGAVVPGAAVTAKRVQTGDVRSTTSQPAAFTTEYSVKSYNAANLELDSAVSVFAKRGDGSIVQVLKSLSSGLPTGAERSRIPLRTAW